MVTFDDFKKLEIIVARIERVRDHPNADKLFILEVNIGETSARGRSPASARGGCAPGTRGWSASGGASGGKKEIVAGIKNFYTKDELIGKDIVMVNNLTPAVIRGVESNGMLLAVEDENGIRLIMPDEPVKPGSRIK